jgi:hypothetical protein
MPGSMEGWRGAPEGQGSAHEVHATPWSMASGRGRSIRLGAKTGSTGRGVGRRGCVDIHAEACGEGGGNDARFV